MNFESTQWKEPWLANIFDKYGQSKYKSAKLSLKDLGFLR